MDEQTVQEYRDGRNQHFQRIVIYHMPIVDSLLHKYVCPRHPFSDLQEVAYYELVVSVRRAQTALKDNNITPYVIRCVSLNLLSYVTFDHLLIYGHKPASRVKETMTRHLMVDQQGQEQSGLDRLIVDERIENAVTSDLQREVITLRLQGYTLHEIKDRIPGITVFRVRTLWSSFIKRVEASYADDDI